MKSKGIIFNDDSEVKMGNKLICRRIEERYKELSLRGYSKETIRYIIGCEFEKKEINK